MKTTIRLMPNASVAACLAACIILGIGSGCRPQRASELSGAWQKVGARDRIEFKDDGTITGVDEYGRLVRGSFSREDDTHIRMDMSVSSTNKGGAVTVDNSSGVCGVELEGGLLCLVDQGGGRVSYRRVP